MKIEHILSDINSHAPVSRRILTEYLDSGDHTYGTKNGETCMITDQELQLLNETCLGVENHRLRLPILISTDTLSLQSAWKIEGKLEVGVISRITRRIPVREDLLMMYAPHLKELQKILPNATVVIFTL